LTSQKRSAEADRLLSGGIRRRQPCRRAELAGAELREMNQITAPVVSASARAIDALV
jgi:hypothetical protein